MPTKSLRDRVDDSLSRAYIRGYHNGQDNLAEKLKAEFVNSYPKNYMGEPELGGASCHFSLNKVLTILDNIGKQGKGERND